MLFGLYEDERATSGSERRQGLWRWKPGPPAFYPLSSEAERDPRASRGRRGRAADCTARRESAIRRRQARWCIRSRRDAPGSGAAALRDRDGGLWIGTRSRPGACAPGNTDVFSQTDGLSGDAVVDAVRGSRRQHLGRDRRRPRPLSRIGGRLILGEPGIVESRVAVRAAARDGSVWVGDHRRLEPMDRAQVTVYRERSARDAVDQAVSSRQRARGHRRGMPAGVQSIFEDRRAVWVSTAHGVGYLESDRFVAVRGVPGGLTRAIAEELRDTCGSPTRSTVCFVCRRGGVSSRRLGPS